MVTFNPFVTPTNKQLNYLDLLASNPYVLPNK